MTTPGWQDGPAVPLQLRPQLPKPILDIHQVRLGTVEVPDYHEGTAIRTLAVDQLARR